MQQLRSIYFIFSITLFAFACQPGSKNKLAVKTDTIALNKDSLTTHVQLSGDYATADYHQRDKGYDWIAVNIQELGKDSLQVKVRSRADLKKPTCTLDAFARRINERSFEVQLPEGTLIIEFEGTQLNIKGKSEKDQAALYFHCSGGASLANQYQKIDNKLVISK